MGNRLFGLLPPAGAGTKRKEWVDALRALAMFLVIYGHLVQGWTPYFVFTSPVKICMFFAISGYVFKYGRVREKDFYLNLLRKIVVPWLVLSMAPYALLIPFRGFAGFGNRFVRVITGETTWYMPCCIIAEIIWHYQNRFLKKDWMLALSSLAFFALGLFLGKRGILDVCMINRAMTAQAYLLIGGLYRKYEETLLRRLGKPLVLGAGAGLYVLLGVLTLLLYPGQAMDVHTHKYYNLLICGAMIVLGILILFMAAGKYMRKCPRVIALVGQNTLVIYLWNGFVISAVNFLSRKTGIPYKGIFPSLITAIAACLACTLAALILKKIVPELFGLKRHRAG